MSSEPTARAQRFYKTVDVKPQEGAFAVTLDGRTLRTPKKLHFLTPTRALAQVCASEWDAQAVHISPDTMPITRLVNVALDFTPGARADIAANIAKYGETDLLSHRAERPSSLVARQAAVWDPLLAWADETLGVKLNAGAGVLAHAQAPEMLAALARHAQELDDFRLTGLAHAVGLTGSAIIGFALARAAIDADEAFDAAALDEIHSLETWGEDSEARKRLDHQKREIEALAAFFAALA